MIKEKVPEFKYGGARALTILHERELYRFVEAWKAAKAQGVVLPPVKNPDYENLEALLYHVIFRALDNMNWICESLGLPEPEISPVPGPVELIAKIDEYLDYLVLELRRPLVDVRGKDFYFKTYTSRWRTEYCIDAMLEHMVMHPLRHTVQLEHLKLLET